MAQRQVRAFHRRSDRDGELFGASRATVESGARRDGHGFIDDAATRTQRTIWPAHAFHMLAAGVIGPEFRHERGQFHNVVNFMRY